MPLGCESVRQWWGRTTEVATKNSESRVEARSGVASESRECGRERESRT